MNTGTRSRVLRGAKLTAPPGWSVHVYDCEAMPCDCRTALAFGVHAAPAAAERRGPQRMCLVCGARWSVDRDGFYPATEVSNEQAG